MADELKPEAVEAIKRLHEQGKALMEALADLARQGEYEFKQHPGREFMDRTEAMRNVMRIRDAYTRMSHGARAALVALGRTDGVPAAPAPKRHRNATDEEVLAWAKRHDLSCWDNLSEARAAFEDAETLHMTYGVPAVAPDLQCWCHTCRPLGPDRMEMVLCPDCGNKRCPKANDHRNACTNSNEPGQKGSAYEKAPHGVKGLDQC